MSRTAWISITILTLAIAGAAIFLAIVPGGPGGTGSAFSSENVNVTGPLQGGTVPKKFIVNGSARGTWYFEASFPVQVRNPENELVGRGLAEAQGEWMTEDFVPFIAEVAVENYSGPATLVLLKDNPSGLPENDDSVSLPIVVE